MIIQKRNLFRASILHHIADTDNTAPCISDLTLLNVAFNVGAVDASECVI